MSLGDNIKHRRTQLGLSQQELAEHMGYRSRSTIAKIESGENDIPRAKLQKLAHILQTTIEALTADGPSLALPVPPDASPAPAGAKTIMVLLAGGTSVRNQQNIPNQFVSILGKPAVVYCLEAYQLHPAVDEIYVVCLSGWEDIMLAYAREYQITKLKALIPGGKTGIESVKNAAQVLAHTYSPDSIVILQESTRPLVGADMISNLIQSCSRNGSATTCRPMEDYVQFLLKEGAVEYVDRNALVSLESPEAYRLRQLTDAFALAQSKGHPLTESCCAMLMYHLGYPIFFVEGSRCNIKILSQEDISIISSLLKLWQ